jgi:xanthine dehydrogenase accessory factor
LGRENGLMREIASQVREGLAAGRSVQVGRVVDFQGFGGRRAGEALAVFHDGPASGSLLGGIADTAIAQSMTGSTPSVLLEIGVGDDEAVAAGLACGGLATVLSSDAAMIPMELWAALEEGWPAALVTREDGQAGSTSLALVDSPESRTLARYGSLGDVTADEEAAQVAREALRLGRDSTEIRLLDKARVVVETYFPTTMLFVLGEGQLAAALAAQGGLLSWATTVEAVWNDATAERVGSLGRPDAVVVLSHDPDVDVPALAAALATGCYVGALGSRHTQSRRRESLGGLGLDDALIDRIHGPVGLDLGARTPEETAVAIASEVLAYRSGRSAGNLRSSSGPING